MKRSGFIVSLKVYPFDIFVWFGYDIERMGKKLKKYVSHTEVDEFTAQSFNRGKTCQFSSGQTVIWLPNSPQSVDELSVLNHEIFHAVTLILNKVGIRLSEDSEEAYAYLIQYVSKQIYLHLPIFS